MKAGSRRTEVGGRRARLGREPRVGRRRNRGAVEDAPEEKRGIAIYWYFLGFSILLVAGLSFVNFMALPDMHSTVHLPKMSQLRGGAERIGSDPLGSQGIRGGNSLPNDARAVAAVVANPALGSTGSFNALYDQGVAAPTTVAPLFPGVAQQHQQQAQDPLASGQDRSRQLVDQAAQAAAKPLLPRAEQAPAPAANPASALAKQAAAGGGIAVLEGESWLRLTRGVDAKELTFGAWIYLPNAPVSAFPQSSQSMKTIASTKISGCKADSELADGWALFVHEWGTFNQQLRLSWTDGRLACNELYSESALVPFDRWVLVGFSLSEARDSARLVIDGNVVADTRANLGSLAKASRKVSMNEASIMARKLQGSAGNLVYGAHLAQTGDAPHVQSHVFFGFLGDMRLLHISPDSNEILKRILVPGAEELLTQGLVRASDIIVQAQFRANTNQNVEMQNQNLADGQPFLREPDSAKRIEFVPFAEHPKHPWFQGNAVAEDVPSAPLSPAPTLAPDALKASWPRAWLEKFSEDQLIESQRRADGWADEVRAAMVHTWRGYRAKAWGHDDLKPLSGRPKDWCRLGIIILDALTTLWLMGLTDEFAQATEWLKANPLPSPGGHGLHSVFEMTIRGLGGLLGAYSLSGQQIFLENAHRLADALLHAFNTPSGMPRSQVDVGTGATRWHSWVKFAVLAEVTTVQVEFRYLSHVLGDDLYKRAGDKAFEAVLQAAGERGLVPIYLTTMEEVPRFGNTKISLGAMGDSYYEYLIKQWVQGGKKEDRLKYKWKVAMGEMLDQLVRKTNGGLTYVCEKDNGNLRHRMDHLACFVAGMLMMGARELPKEEVDPRWEPTAAGLAETCHEMYRRSPSGLSPEYVVFHPERSTGQDMTIPNDAPHNLLRPEAAEAIYYMHYYTGDPKYREWAHEMFQAFERNSKATWGYAAVRDVRAKPGMKRDDMESFWAAETLKYLYLTQAPRSKLSMEEYVFNTEAHPLKRWVE